VSAISRPGKPHIPSQAQRPASQADDGSELDDAVSTLRRRLLKTALFLPIGAALAGCSSEATSKQPFYRRYFTADERRFVDAATARLIPDGDDHSGATAAAVAFFIDRQLVGSYGQAETWYMQGPWQKGAPEQGYQLAYTPAALYRAAIKEINNYCQSTFHRAFADLSAAKQDELLHKLEQGKIDLKEIPSDTFFAQLWKNTQEGYLSDPMYGGNRNFVGWKLIGFPGPRYNYVEDITLYGKPYAQPTVGLLGRDGKRILKG
jgi:gluconate 2-dehydrogenase gamma chain